MLSNLVFANKQNSTNIDNASLDGFFGGTGLQVSSELCFIWSANSDEQSTTVAGIRVGTRTCLIMDEVDGMSAGDRGGVGALNFLIKKTKVRTLRIRIGQPVLMTDTDGFDL